MNIERAWAMPNRETFKIKPIKHIIQKYTAIVPGLWLNPFAGNSDIGFTNDLDPKTSATFHIDALEFLRQCGENDFSGCLFDPPYSLRQLVEVYRAVGKSVNMQTTQNSYWSAIKEEIGRTVKPGGVVISFGWNTIGMGKKNGFRIIEILIVSHGGMHNDTLVTVEKKVVE